MSSFTSAWPWVALLLLGAMHGINPAMGWLFAVGLGLQEERRSAVWRAMPPLAIGHALAIVVALVVAVAIGAVMDSDSLKWLVAALLIGVGVYRLFRHQHPRLRGMRVGARELTAWSFFMATAHGAGLMAVPFLLGATGGAMDGVTQTGHSGHAAHMTQLHAGASAEQALGLLAAAVHSVGYLLVTVLVALVVYEKLGVKLLRKAWVNLDLIWSGALIATGLLTPFL